MSRGHKDDCEERRRGGVSEQWSDVEETQVDEQENRVFKYSLRREAVWTALDGRTVDTEGVGAGRQRNLPVIPSGFWKLGVFLGGK